MEKTIGKYEIVRDWSDGFWDLKYTWYAWLGDGSRPDRESERPSGYSIFEWGARRAAHSALRRLAKGHKGKETVYKGKMVREIPPDEVWKEVT